MLKCLKKIDKAKTGIFAAGVLFGTAGIKVLSSKDAKKLYTNCTCLLYTSGGADRDRQTTAMRHP